MTQHKPAFRSKAEELGHDLAVLTRQIDLVEGGTGLGYDSRGGQGSVPSYTDFHPRVAAEIREHCVGLLKAARAELLVELAKEVGLPARYEESLEGAVIVQHPPAPPAPALPPEGPEGSEGSGQG